MEMTWLYYGLTALIIISVFFWQSQRFNARLKQETRERELAEHERHELQKQLLQSQKMEMIGQMTGGIAHDFNNILTSILGYAQLALEEYEELPEDTIQSLSEVQNAGMRAKELVQKMLAFARQSKGEVESFDPVPLVKEVMQMLKPVLPAGIKLVSHMDSKVADISLTSTELHQIITNLVINARDAIPSDKGCIEVGLSEHRNFKGSCSACHKPVQGNFVELYVKDSGSGIPAEVLPNIFDPFYSTKAAGKGSGLGLSVIMGIMHRYGGHIDVDSHVGEGTTFRLLFPILAATEMLSSNVIPLPEENQAVPAVIENAL
jgi:signal transduction histidine kinase